MPYPRKGEKKKKYLQRCMSHSHTQKWESKQRYAVCNSLWDKGLTESIKWSFQMFLVEILDEEFKKEHIRSSYVKKLLGDRKTARLLEPGKYYSLVRSAHHPNKVMIKDSSDKIVDDFISERIYVDLKKFKDTFEKEFTFKW